MEYKIEDIILSKIGLPDPCPIKVKIDDKYIRLYIGQRDWQWDKKTGRIIGCGTAFCQETAFRTNLPVL